MASMRTIWHAAGVDVLDFAATATILAVKAKQRSLATVEQPHDEASDDSDSDFDEVDDWAASKQAAPLTTTSRDALINKFLDRLGELFSREKSSRKHGGQQGSKYVAALGWIRPSTTSPLTIILAKNEGLDDPDLRMRSQLQLWLRTVSLTGQYPRFASDLIWTGDNGLVVYSRGRLWYHISQITHLDHYGAMDINLNRFRKNVQRLAREFRLPKCVLKSKTAHKYMRATRLHVHAEVQVLVSLATNVDWHQRAHRYIGISKKPCFLCDQILQNYIMLSMQGAREPAFKARQTHGKIYPLWTLPRNNSVPNVVGIAMATAVNHAYYHVQRHLQHEVALRPAIAESSASITERTSMGGGFTTIRKQHLESRHLQGPSKVVQGREDPIILGRNIKTVRVALLPADGSPPKLVPIDFHALPEKSDRRLPQCGNDYVPNFHHYWGECQFERRFRILSLKRQVNEELDGEYRLYWNENYELPEDESVKVLIGIEKANLARRFWYGDAFVVRFSEQPTTFGYDVQDTPLAIFEGGFLKNLFQNMWETQFLEEKLADNCHFEAHKEKIEADKDIIFERMTPVEQAVLSRMPPGTLEYLAIVACDDGAIGDSSIVDNPDDPSMKIITTLQRRTALESLDWHGFHSSQL
ncbi:hypothetical protein EK21DRAFT_111983 [Setomelanomma holmii]|uniref:Uncharacterized protein n=1 Tax=Setomelanomma holmii TaxID=210430 RepID=A0A9P4H8X8_9PLEO|nr:hypothetical protein EK21DRAFT_111983 [Setomelanomma holmii]